MLKKAASGVLALLPCSRTESTLRVSKWLRPCWTDFFEHSLPLMRAGLPGVSMGHGPELFNKPTQEFVMSDPLCVEEIPFIFFFRFTDYALRMTFPGVDKNP